MSEDYDLLLAFGTPAVVAFGAGYALSRTLGVLFQVLVIPLSPIVFYAIGEALRELGAFGADPRWGFEDSFDNIELFVGMVVVLIGWELGIVGGAIHGAIRRRRDSG